MTVDPQSFGYVEQDRQKPLKVESPLAKKPVIKSNFGYVPSDETGDGVDTIAAIIVEDEWALGFEVGQKDGRAHKRREFYETDAGRSFRRYSNKWVEGYLAGYRTRIS